MFKAVKLAHIGGLVVFLGSVLTFVVISALIEGASLESIAFGRQIISAGTNMLTLPGIWVLALSGIWIGYTHYGPRTRFFQVKVALMTVIILNAHFLVAPAVTSATELAQQSLQQGTLLAEYKEAYMRESLFGAVNVLLAFVAAAIGVWKAGGRPANR